MIRRLTLVLALTFGLVAAGAATWLLAGMESEGPPGSRQGAAVVERERVPSTPVAAGASDEIGDKSRAALREILRDAD